MLFKRSNQEMHVYNKQYAVGQGGLHLSNIIYLDKFKEQWSHFAYIYDCGSINSNLALLQEQIDALAEDIKKQFYPLDNLYIFISHLHEDHVNGLVKLKNTLVSKKVISEHTDKRLFLPYTSNMEKNIIIAQYKVDGGSNYNDYRRFIENPQDYFDNFYDVYFVDDGNDNDKINTSDHTPNECCFNNQYNDTAVPQPYKDNIYSHHQEFKIGCKDYWVLRMFYKSIDKKLLDKIKNNIHIDFDTISDETIEYISDKYTKILGENAHNRSSLCLYSGPCSHIDGSGFIHTGDIELLTKKTHSELANHYKNYLHNVVIAQIPHHGSKENSKLSTFDIFNNLRLLYVTKQKTPNGTTQQPKLHSEYLQKGFVHQITEDSNSTLSFINVHALDTIFISIPTIKEQNENQYDSYTGVLKFEYQRGRNFPEKLDKHGNTYITRTSSVPRMLTPDKELFLTFVDEERTRKPIVIGRAKTLGFIDSNIINDGSRFRYFVRLYDIELVKNFTEDGIPLSDIIGVFGLSMFPGSRASNPNNTYRQKSYRRISDEAKDYINRRLDEIGLVRLD